MPSDESSERELESKTGLETHDHRIEKSGEVGAW